jgi:hypothetical protein
VYDARSAHTVAQLKNTFAHERDARLRCATRFATQMRDVVKIPIKYGLFGVIGAWMTSH